MYTAKVGDMVGYCRFGGTGGHMMGAGFGHVTKINGHGHIFLDTGKVFDKHGDERGTKYGLHLVDAEHLRDRLTNEQARQNKAAMVRSLIQKLEGSFSYSGTVHIDGDTKQELLAMVNSL